jgi:hypothetical protein
MWPFALNFKMKNVASSGVSFMPLLLVEGPTSVVVETVKRKVFGDEKC